MQQGSWLQTKQLGIRKAHPDYQLRTSEKPLMIFNKVSMKFFLQKQNHVYKRDRCSQERKKTKNNLFCTTYLNNNHKNISSLNLERNSVEPLVPNSGKKD